ARSEWIFVFDDETCCPFASRLLPRPVQIQAIRGHHAAQRLAGGAECGPETGLDLQQNLQRVRVSASPCGPECLPSSKQSYWTQPAAVRGSYRALHRITPCEHRRRPTGADPREDPYES